MAGYENIKDKGFDKRTTGELREISSKGGKSSGESRRRTAAFRKTLNTLLTTPIDHPEWTPILEALGMESTLEAALNMAMVKEGLAGNVRAYEAIAKYAGQSADTEATEEEQRIRTDRAKRARDMEVGEKDSGEDNIKSFLKAMNPSPEDIQQLYSESEEREYHGEDSKETS